MLAYAFLKPLDAEVQFDMALSQELPEELIKWSAPLEQAFVDLKNWVVNEGAGRVLSLFGYQMSMEMPLDKITALTGFLKKFEYTAKAYFSVGIGMNPKEAYLAMLQSEAEGARRVVLYTEDIEGDNQMSKSEDGGIHSQLISNLGLDEAEAEGAEAPTKDSGQPDPKTQKEEQTAKQKIIETLMMLKEHAPTISQLKELNPKAFEAVKKVVDAMIMMAQRDLSKAEPDLLPGGLADNKPKEDFDPEQLEEGIAHEMEHTNDRQIASEIARDHLTEDPDYYKKLEKKDALGKIKDGKIRIQARDMATRKVTGEHWHQIKAGQALGPTGHAVSAKEPNKE